MNVHPVSGVRPDVAEWLERRRARLEAQLAALEAERLAELSALLAGEGRERPPRPETTEEREAYLELLRAHERLAQRMAALRSRLLEELKDLERERVAGPAKERSRALGHSFDGYA